VRLLDVGTGDVLWRHRSGAVVALAWSADGSRLAVVGPRRVELYSARGMVQAVVPLPQGTRATAAGYSPRGETLAVLLGAAGASEVVLLEGRQLSQLQRSPGRLTSLAWSPNGRLLLVSWESADEWLFLPVAGGDARAVGEIAAEFASGEEEGARYPQVEGWVSSP
jgi:WD40 repeat protein